jgi:hypothetical protein
VTAILYPGDKIHLQIPVAGVTRTGALLTHAEVQSLGEETASSLTEFYAQLGVQVAIWTASTSDPTTRIVAIFRKEEA